MAVAVSSSTLQRLKVYVWRPTKDNVGHCSMSLPDGTYISWWPEGECSQNSPSRNAQPQDTFEQDAVAEKEPNPPTFSIKVDDEQVNKIKKWWDDFKTKEKYHILDMNCSSVIYIALKTAFPSLECFQSTETKVEIWTPVAIQKLAEYLVTEDTDFSKRVAEVSNASLAEARQIAANGGVKSNKVTIQKVRKILAKCEDKAKSCKKLEEEDETESKKSQTAKACKKKDTKKQNSETNKNGSERGGKKSQSSKVCKTSCKKTERKQQKLAKTEEEPGIKERITEIIVSDDSEDEWETADEAEETDIVLPASV